MVPSSVKLSEPIVMFLVLPSKYLPILKALLRNNPDVPIELASFLAKTKWSSTGQYFADHTVLVGVVEMELL